MCFDMLDTARAVEASLSISPSTSNIIELQFVPLKPITAAVDLLVTQRAGLGRWRIPISLSASFGGVDGIPFFSTKKKWVDSLKDMISIHSSGGKPGGVAFGLKNAVTGRSPFVATLSPSLSNLSLGYPQSISSSALPFSVLPAKGLLSNDEETVSIV